MRLSTLLGVGMTPGLLAHYTNYCRRNCPLDTTLCRTRRSHRALVGALGRYVPLSRRVQIYHLIWMNLHMSSPSTVNSCCSNNLWNGGCVLYGVHLAACMSHSQSRTYHSDRIYWKFVSASTMCGCGVLV